MCIFHTPHHFQQCALVHSEGIHLGELKHGPLALVDEVPPSPPLFLILPLRSVATAVARVARAVRLQPPTTVEQGAGGPQDLKTTDAVLLNGGALWCWLQPSDYALTPTVASAIVSPIARIACLSTRCVVHPPAGLALPSHSGSWFGPAQQPVTNRSSWARALPFGVLRIVTLQATNQSLLSTVYALHSICPSTRAIVMPSPSCRPWPSLLRH